MAVITVSRQFASGGARIAERVAERLGWTLVDHEFVDRVAERVGLPPEEVARREERVATLIERLAKTLAVSSPEVFLTGADLSADAPKSPEDLVRITEAVIHETAEHGNVVLVGRGAQACLGRRDDTLHVRVVAPEEDRIRAAGERLELSEKDAQRKVHRIDQDRKAYVETYYKRNWNDAANYHLVVNSSLLTYDQAVDLIVQTARARFGDG